METQTGSVLTADYSDILESQKRKAIELRATSAGQRKAKLRKIRNWIVKHRKDIQQALYNDYQKPFEETDLSEIYVVISEIRHALRNLSQWTKIEKADTPLALLGSRSYIRYEPKGTCLIIAPWNYPFNLMISPLVSAIAAGNTAILKPSEMTPNTSALISAMIAELFDSDEVTVVEGDAKVAGALLELPFDHIFFTGSPRVGKIIMEAAAKHLSTVTLELGGKSPAIVDETASVKDTAEKLVAGKFVNNGQTCLAPDYVIVHETIREKLVDAMKEQISKYYNPDGLGIENSRAYGRLVSKAHHQRMKDLIEDALQKGATVKSGGRYLDEHQFLEPTLVINVPLNSRIMQEEIFGPVFPVITYKDMDQVLTDINRREKPLALYIFSRKRSRQRKVLQNSSSGTACVNECVVHFLNHYLPFGGINNSGIGKSHGFYGFRAFSNEKAVFRQRVGFTTAKLLSPPYNRFSRFVINVLLKYL